MFCGIRVSCGMPIRGFYMETDALSHTNREPQSVPAPYPTCKQRTGIGYLLYVPVGLTRRKKKKALHEQGADICYRAAGHQLIGEKQGLSKILHMWRRFCRS